MAGLPATAERDAKGQFVKGNRGGPGRAFGSRLAPSTYRAALQRACGPADLYEITKRAVTDAKKGDHFARMFVAKIMGLDSLRITIDPAAPGSPMPVYHFDNLTDGEIEIFDRLSNKMLTGPAE